MQNDLDNNQETDKQDDILIKHESICFSDDEFEEDLMDDLKSDNIDDPQNDCNSYMSADNQLISSHHRSNGNNGEIPEKPSYQCEMCGEIFAERPSILNHLHKHLGHRPFACNQCDATFIVQRTLRAHRAREHSNGAALRFACDQPGCTKSYIMKHLLSSHVRSVHLGYRRKTDFVCDSCGISKTTARCLQQHMYLHKQPAEWPFACDSCEKRFRSKYTLNVHHKRIHLRIKNLVCSECSARFVTNQELNQHMVTHNLEPPVECPHCARSFSSKSEYREFEIGPISNPFTLYFAGNLNHHLKRIHEAVKLHACDKCASRFAMKRDLTQHVRNVHMKKAKPRKRDKLRNNIQKTGS